MSRQPLTKRAFQDPGPLEVSEGDEQAPDERDDEPKPEEEAK